MGGTGGVLLCRENLEVLLLLPPSETKRAGGGGHVLDPANLAFPELRRIRNRTVSALVRLARTPRTAARVLELGTTQGEEITRNAQLRSSPTMAAVERYTGVLYEALDVASLAPRERNRLDERVAISSALFGLVAANDDIPAYRLSASSRLSTLGSLTRLWRPVLQPILMKRAQHELIVDLRSAAYRSLAPLPDAVTVRVLTERPDGTRAVVSHFNKATKGRVARALARSERTCAEISEVAATLVDAGMRVELESEFELVVVTA